MSHIVFANPKFFFLLLLLIPIIAWYFYKRKKAEATVSFSSLRGFKNIQPGYKVWLRHVLFGVRIIVFLLIVVILARPQSTNRSKDVTTEGIDIVITLDISGSMLAEDFKPNRLEAAKDVATEFINGRPNDRIGLVIFSSESFTQCPLTTDHAALLNLFSGVKMGMIEDGTAIGNGLATAVNRLKDSKAISRVIILLTDGVNNMGSIAPISAAEIAKVFGVRVYTIGIGTRGVAPYPVQTPFGVQYQDMDVDIDEAMLKQIAQITDGKYYRATNNQTLREIYSEIDKLEKSRIEVREYRRHEEEYYHFGVAILLLLIGEIALRNTLLRSIP
jgi:Ca-activated chloride channel family protein